MTYDLLPSILYILSAIVSILCATIYLHLKRTYKYWENLGVPGPKPEMVYGSMKRVFMLQETEADCMDTLYKEYGTKKYIGIFNLWKPLLVVNDPDLITKITETDFNYFIDHPEFDSYSNADCILKSLFFMKGAEWKKRRQCMSKLFTPMKLKDYLLDVRNCLDTLLGQIKKHSSQDKDIELSEVFDGFCVRFIASVFYGMDLSKDEKTTNQLIEMSEVFSKPAGITALKLLFYAISPGLYTFLRIQTFPDKVWTYFSLLVDELIKARASFNIDRKDLVAILKNLRENGLSKNEKIPLTEAVAHMYVFFTAAHHTVLMTICHTLLQISIDSEVQRKIHKEVDDVLQGTDEITYEHLGKMVYMEAVVTETMRMYPLLGVVKRKCTQPYRVDDNFTIPKDTDIYFPVSSLHNDPRYFPEPEKFIPERFLDRVKHAAYMPFGKGPRICIGARFGEIVIKLTLARIMKDYMVLPSDKMKFPLKFEANTIFVTNRPQGGIWLRIKPRNDQKSF